MLYLNQWILEIFTRSIFFGPEFWHHSYKYQMILEQNRAGGCLFIEGSGFSASLDDSSRLNKAVKSWTVLKPHGWWHGWHVCSGLGAYPGLPRLSPTTSFRDHYPVTQSFGDDFPLPSLWAVLKSSKLRKNDVLVLGFRSILSAQSHNPTQGALGESAQP